MGPNRDRSRSAHRRIENQCYTFRTPLRVGTTWKPSHDGLSPDDVGGLRRISLCKGGGFANKVVAGCGALVGGVAGGAAGGLVGGPGACVGGVMSGAGVVGKLASDQVGYEYNLECNSKNTCRTFYFKDDTDEQYSVRVINPMINHNVGYNSCAPEIVKVSWSNNPFF